MRRLGGGRNGGEGEESGSRTVGEERESTLVRMQF